MVQKLGGVLMSQMHYFMSLAISEASKAANTCEVPIGAVVVKDGKVISKAHNMREGSNQVAAHAEMLAIEQACNLLKSWRLENCDIYVTMEPCPMCAGAILQARIRNVYFGCYDKKAGAFGTIADLSTLAFNHNTRVYGGILEDECRNLIRSFFEMLRKQSENKA
jgi:tRNA(adenine34) deaminase